MEPRQLLSGGPLEITITEQQTGQSVTLIDNAAGDANSTVGNLTYSTPAVSPFRDFSLTNYQLTSNRTTATTTATLEQSGLVTRTTTTNGPCTLVITAQDSNYLYPATDTSLLNSSIVTFANTAANAATSAFQSTYTAGGISTQTAAVNLSSAGTNPDSHNGSSTATISPSGTAPFNLQNVYTVTLPAMTSTSAPSATFQDTGESATRGTNGSLAGNVYLDNDLSGSLDTGDTGIGTVTVTLTGVDADGNSVNRTMPTATDGSYKFANLTTGVYTVTETPPAGYLQAATTPGIPGDGFATSPGLSPASTSSIVVNGGQNLTNYNFGEWLPVTIGDYVWNDSNANGVQDGGETGIPNVALNLTGQDALGDAITATTSTDGSGHYLFTEPPGTYSVSIDNTQAALSGFTPTTVNATGSTAANDSNPDPSGTAPSLLTFTGASSDLTVDFGYYQDVTVGDYVWNDSNADGIQTAGETGIAGVTLTLTGTNGSGGSVTDHTTTNGSGAYLFTECRAATR